MSAEDRGYCRRPGVSNLESHVFSIVILTNFAHPRTVCKLEALGQLSHGKKINEIEGYTLWIQIEEEIGIV